MTSKADPRGHPGLKLCEHVSVMGYYRFINFHQNRRGSGIFLGDFTWNDPRSRPKVKVTDWPKWVMLHIFMCWMVLFAMIV